MSDDPDILVHFIGGPLDGKRELVSRSNIVGGIIRTIQMGTFKATITAGPHRGEIEAPDYEVVTYYLRRSAGGYSAHLRPPSLLASPRRLMTWCTVHEQPFLACFHTQPDGPDGRCNAVPGRFVPD